MAIAMCEDERLPFVNKNANVSPCVPRVAVFILLPTAFALTCMGELGGGVSLILLLGFTVLLSGLLPEVPPCHREHPDRARQQED